MADFGKRPEVTVDTMVRVKESKIDWLLIFKRSLLSRRKNLRTIKDFFVWRQMT